MSLEQNNDIGLAAACMDNSTGNQLVPYYPGRNRILPHAPNAAHLPASADDPPSKRSNLISLPVDTRTEIQPDHPEAAYNSDLRLEKPKMTQVGLLIDIYA